MALNDVEAEIGQQHERQTLDDGQLVRHLRVNFLMFVVRGVVFGQEMNAVEAQVAQEEHGIVDEKGSEEFQNQAS